MRKVFVMIMALILVLACLSGCGTSPGVGGDTSAATGSKDVSAGASTEPGTEGEYDYTLALIVMDLSNPFFATMVEAANEYADENNICLYVTDGAGDSSTQIAAIENYITMGVQGIAIMPVDGEALETTVGDAMSKGIPVITHSNKTGNEAVYACPTDRDMGLALGTAAGQWMTDTFGSEGAPQYAILDQSTSPNVINRVAAIKEKIAEYCPNAVCKAQVDGYTAEGGMEAAENIMTANPDVCALVCINDSGALGAYEAVMAMSGIDYDKLFIGGVDGTSDACKLISQGTCYRCSVDNAPAYTGGYLQELLIEAINGKTWSEAINIPVTAITTENVAEFLK